LWQAYAHMYFRMAGGYTGPAIIDDFQRWPVVNAMYWGIDMPDIAEQLGAFLTAHEVKYVVVQVSRMPTDSPVLAALGELRAEQAYAEPGLQLYRVPPNELAKYREVDPLALEQRWDRYRFDRLVIAADKYLSSGGSLAELKPSRAKAMKLLPSTWAMDDDIYSRDGLILGPWKDGSVEIGLVGSYDALRPLIDAYRKDAREVYFPFPRPLIAAPKGNLFMRKLVMVFDRAGLETAAAHATGDISQ
jgi:hypothetical protein